MNKICEVLLEVSGCKYLLADILGVRQQPQFYLDMYFTALMLSEESCLFCRLKNVVENIVYEDDMVYVIVDRFPMSIRHLLIISKAHFRVLHDCDDATASNLLVVAKKLAKALEMDKYNILQNNINHQEIPHVHVHLIECNGTGRFSIDTSNAVLKLSDEDYNKIVSGIKKELTK